MVEQAERNRVRVAFNANCDGKTIDGADVILAIRCLNLNPTIELVNSLGGTDKRGEAELTFDDFWKVYLGVRDDKNMGGFHDFVECLKVYDISENGTMRLVDLTHMLLNLGERITEDELDEVLTDCMLEQEDDNGWIPYLPFLCRLCDRPVPKSWIPE